MTASFQPRRLLLVPLTLSQLRLCLTDLPALEAELGLSISRDVLTERVQRAIQMKIEKMTNLDESLHPWQTYWLIVISVEMLGPGWQASRESLMRVGQPRWVMASTQPIKTKAT